MLLHSLGVEGSVVGGLLHMVHMCIWREVIMNFVINSHNPYPTIPRFGRISRVSLEQKTLEHM